MKTIFIPIFDGAISKNILRTDVLKILKQNYRIVLFVSDTKFEYHQKHFAGENVIIERIPPPRFPWLEQRLMLLSLHALHTNTIRIKIFHYFHKHGNVLLRAVKMLLWHLGRSRLLHRFARYVYLHIPDRSFAAYFDKYQPSAVFAPNIIANVDYRAIKEARRRGVASIGLPKGWDNLSAKTFFLILPDYLLVQNKAMREEALALYGFPEERLEVVGFPNFDIYAKREHLKSREEFYGSLGLDPRKKTILYAIAGDALAPHDEEVFNDLVSLIEHDDELRASVQVHARPHPKYKYRGDVLARPDFVRIDDPGIRVGDKRSGWEFRDDDIVHLANSLYHADVLICTLSTLSIESAVFDTPIISIAYDGLRTIDYYDSVRRYYDYSHMRPLVTSGGVWAAGDKDALGTAVRAYVKDPTLHKAERARTVDLYVGSCDGRAGQRVADFITRVIENASTSPIRMP